MIVVDRLKVHGPSDRRGKLLACWPSHAVTILTSFVPQESHIGHVFFWFSGTIGPGHPKKNKAGRLLKDDQEICSSHDFFLHDFCVGA